MNRSFEQTELLGCADAAENRRRFGADLVARTASQAARGITFPFIAPLLDRWRRKYCLPTYCRIIQCSDRPEPRSCGPALLYSRWRHATTRSICLNHIDLGRAAKGAFVTARRLRRTFVENAVIAMKEVRGSQSACDIRRRRGGGGGSGAAAREVSATAASIVDVCRSTVRI